MTRYTLLTLPLILYSLACRASTNIVSCESLRDLNNPNPKLCICKESLFKLPITIPTGFSLTSACNYHKPYGDDVIGNYTFHGNAVLSGVITRWADFESEEGQGSYLAFSADKKIPFSQFGSVTSSFSFRDEEKAARQLRAPKLTRSSSCWEAPVTITLSALVVEVGHGTDTEGTFAEKFKVKQIGKYAPCKSR